METDAKAEAEKQTPSNLTSINNTLDEIYGILDAINDKLEYIEGSGGDKSGSEKPKPGSITMGLIIENVDSIRRKSNTIARNVNSLIGN